ncbi:MAG: SDR family oxidoreductase [Candidatus Kapaibacterium sp.]
MKNKKKTAIITGSVKRLGREIALRLAELDFNVVLNYFNSSDEEAEKTLNEVKEKGADAICVKADLKKVEDIKKLFAKTEEKYGRLDLLVNNAAIFERKDFLEVTEEDFDNFISMNLKNAFFCTQEAARMMMTNEDSPCSIINISSLGGIENWKMAIPYSVAKAGLIKLTKLTAKRLAPQILVNSIAPGTIWIEGDKNTTVIKSEEAMYPMKRFGKAEDLNSIIEYLAVKNKWTTGNVFVVDGGKSL